ncbi:MAG: lysoplasmalogenase [Candidatus Roseilinea sp.]|uniref:lysoplasmalogenase n=1 Tax=Candidatus Roseilinea sp. TaxID=2838777 RepID=UPI00404BA0B9
MQPIILALPIALSATIAIAADYRGARRAVYVFKPLTTLLILLAAVLAPAPFTPLYQTLIVAGLLFSLVGDVLLMLPGDRFLPGLVSFLLAHVCYISAFVADAGLRVSAWIVPCAACYIILMRILWPRADRMQAPVSIYGLVIVTMLWQAVGRAAAVSAMSASMLAGPAWAALGAALFVLSDFALAYNRFVRPFRAAQLLVLTTYWAGQLLIALSID